MTPDPVPARESEIRFTNNGQLIAGFGIGMAFGAWTEWAWWGYVLMFLGLLISLCLRAMWDIYHEGRVDA